LHNAAFEWIRIILKMQLRQYGNVLLSTNNSSETTFSSPLHDSDSKIICNTAERLVVKNVTILKISRLLKAFSPQRLRLCLPMPEQRLVATIVPTYSQRQLLEQMPGAAELARGVNPLIPRRPRYRGESPRAACARFNIAEGLRR
jgi:hypothetical protein